MKPSELTDSEKLKVLELKADGESYDYIVTGGGIHHRREKAIECVKWFTEALSWDEAKAYSGNNQKMLGLRADYFGKKIAEARDYEETIKSNMMQLRHEVGLPYVYHYMKDGHSVMEF